MKKLLLLSFSTVTLLLAGCEDAEDQEKEQLRKDIKIIDAYLAENGIDAEVHSSGLRYIIHEPGNSVRPQLSSEITVTYALVLMDNGELVDASSEPITFPLSRLVEAWRHGLPLIGEGGSMTLFAPSGMGYGPGGAGTTIPPYANLIFNLELIKVD